MAVNRIMAIVLFFVVVFLPQTYVLMLTDRETAAGGSEDRRQLRVGVCNAYSVMIGNR